MMRVAQSPGDNHSDVFTQTPNISSVLCAVRKEIEFQLNKNFTLFKTCEQNIITILHTYVLHYYILLDEVMKAPDNEMKFSFK